jgi:hypothetical protein
MPPFAGDERFGRSASYPPAEASPGFDRDPAPHPYDAGPAPEHEGQLGAPRPVPQQRPPAEPVSGDLAAQGGPPAGRAVSASASVPMASRISPQDAPPQGPQTGAPQPRVYGRPPGPAEPEAAGRWEVEATGRWEAGPGPMQAAGPAASPPTTPPALSRAPIPEQPGQHPGPGDQDRYRALRESYGPPENQGRPGPHQGDFGPPGAYPRPDERARPDQFRQPGAFAEPGGRPEESSGPGEYAPHGGRPEPYAHSPYGVGAPPGDRAYDQPPGTYGPGQGGFDGPDAAPGGPGGWQQGDQGRFDSYRPEEQTGSEAEPEPTPHVRNGRVLAAVIGAALLLLVLPLGISWGIWLASSSGNPSFDVGSCVKQSGTKADAVDCAEAGAFQIVSKVANESECPDRNQPAAILPDGEGREKVLCLKPAPK